MNIGYIGESAQRTIIEHSKVTLGVNEDTEAVIVEEASREGPLDLPCINTSAGIRALSSSPEMLDNFNEVHEIVPGYSATHLYGFLGPDGLSDMLEMTQSSRFLTGDIGVQIGFCQGTGIKCMEDLSLAIPAISEIVDTLMSLGYRGEVAFGLTKNYQVCRVQLGHFSGAFALYTELSVVNAQANYEWCLGVGDGGRLYTEGICVTTLLSYPPYPHDLTQAFSIKAPVGAEKHLYRSNQGLAEVAYAAAWGKDIFEAKRRCRKTIENCRAYNKDIQYRIDYGYGETFVLSNDRWLAFGGKEPRGSSQR